jgi:hypothetical protein
MAEFVRVRWIGLKPARESSIAAHRFDPERHEELDKPAVDDRGEPLPAKYHTTVDEAAAARWPGRQESTAPEPFAAPAEALADDGHQASETEESN